MQLAQAQPPRNEFSVTENKLLTACSQHIVNEALDLPTIPEAAVKIRRAINDESVNSSKISRIIQTDPSLTARLIKISNSPLYRGRKTIESCPEAITRLGLKAVQDIVTAFSLKVVFKAKTPFIRQQMIELWTHSSYVAAISAALAHKAKGFDPDRAMLAGLIHDIGKVPILIFADQHSELSPTLEHVNETTEKLHKSIGLNIIREWGFPSDFEDVISASEDWQRDTGEPTDYADIVMLAQVHSLIGKVDIKTLPKIGLLPAYLKIAGNLDADASISILDVAKDEIVAIRQLLG